MTPKEMAKALFNKFNDATLAFDSGDYSAEGINGSIMAMVNEAKRCALICCDEMIGMLPFPEDEWHLERKEFLLEVKQEVELL